MRKIVLLVAIVSMLGSCQKKEYPTFTYPAAAYLHQPAAASLPTAIAPQPLSASTEGGIQVATETEIAEATIPAEAISDRIVTTSAPSLAAPAKRTWQQKLITKKIEKQIKKANSPEKAKAAKEKPDTISLLSLIFGGAGLLLVLAGSGLGLLLGIAGLVMGIIGLRRVKNGQAPSNSKTLALLGLIFGGVVTLLALYAIAALSAYGFV